MPHQLLTSHQTQRANAIQRGSFPSLLSPKSDIQNVNIDGYVRHLSDWLVILEIPIDTFISRCKPGRSVVTALLGKVQHGKDLDNYNRLRPIILPPRRLSKPKLRRRILGKWLTLRANYSTPITDLAYSILFNHIYPNYRLKRGTYLSLDMFVRYYGLIDTQDEKYVFDSAIQALTRHGVLTLIVDKYYATPKAAQLFFTDEVFRIGVIKYQKFAPVYNKLITDHIVYSVPRLMAGKSPGYEQFRKLCKKFNIKRTKLTLGAHLKQIFDIIDQRFEIDDAGFLPPTRDAYPPTP